MNTDDTTAPSGSAEWEFPTLAYLWDYQNRAIIAGAEQLESLSGTDRARSLTALSDRVRALACGLDDGWLVETAFFMIDDLYKSCFNEFRWSLGVQEYIAATVGTFMQELERRGFVLHYVIDNVQSEANLGELLVGVPAVFDAAGLVVTGPQLMALRLIENAGDQRKDVTAIQLCREIGHDAADKMIEDYHQARRSSVYLNLDLDDDTPAVSLDVALSQANTPGVIVVFRNQSPSAGSTAQIAPPPGVTLPAFGSP